MSYVNEANFINISFNTKARWSVRPAGFLLDSLCRIVVRKDIAQAAVDAKSFSPDDAPAGETCKGQDEERDRREDLGAGRDGGLALLE